MSIADAVRARELEKRVAALEERVAALELEQKPPPEPSPQAKAFVANLERAQASRRALKADDAA